MTVSAYNQELPRHLPFRRAVRAYGGKYFVFIDIGCCRKPPTRRLAANQVSPQRRSISG
jgi:hypothetical protein